MSEYVKSAALLGELDLIDREYRVGDIAHYMPILVITATNDRHTNHSAMMEASGLNIPVSVADNREECTCYFPAIMENDSFIMGLVSKDGNHSAVSSMAEEIRELLRK